VITGDDETLEMVTVIQEENSNYISIDPTRACLLQQQTNDCECDRTIESNVQWTATANKSFIEFSPHSGSGTTDMCIKLAEGDWDEDDDGKITISGGGITRQINVLLRVEQNK